MSYRHLACLVLIGLLAFPTPGNTGFKTMDAFSPVVALNPSQQADHRHGNPACYLLGGWSKDGWLQDKAAGSLLHGGEKYRSYSLNRELGTAVGGPPHPLGEINEPCHDTLVVSFTAAPEGREGLVAVGGSFNPLPRMPRLQSTKQKVYINAAAAILRQKGITRPNVRLTQVIRVDLEGDGTEEVLVSATYYAKGLSPSAAPGDYSLVFLRRLVKGTVATRVIAGDFFPKGVQFGAPGEHRVGAVLDLNGDGVMEIVLFGRYYEGEWAAAYRADRDKVIKIFSAGCGL
jgi:hypothetical protein